MSDIANLALALENLTVGYDGFEAARGVTATLRPGTLVGLIGANGAGKTSILRACAGLIAPTAGGITLGDRAIADWPRTERARAIGYLAQDRTVLWPLTVARLVALGRLPHLGAWDRPSAADANAIARAMDEADVLQFAARTATTLSGGELTRVLIARLLAGEPGIVLADEPIAGLDPAHRLRVLALFRTLARAGRLVVTVLHDLSLAARFCDRLLLMSEGHLIADGAPRDVLTVETLAQAYGVEAKIETIDGELVVMPWSVGGPK